MKMKMFRNLLSVVILLAGSTKLHALDMAQQYPEHVCANGNIQHMIIWHNTLSQAAKYYGVSQSAIQAANANITDPNRIYMGNTMSIPCGTAARTTAIVRKARKAVAVTAPVVAVVAPPSLPALTVNDVLNGLHHDEIALEASTTDSTELESQPTADLPIAESAFIATSVTPPVQSLPKGWYSITVHENGLSQAIATGMFPAVFLDNFADDGKWKDRKDTGVKVVKNDDDTVTITTLLPETLKATSAIAFIAYDDKGNVIGKHFFTGSTLLEKVQYDEVQRLPAPDFAKFNFGNRKIAEANKQVLHATFEKQPSHKLVHFVKNYGLIIAQNAVVPFVPALVIPTGIADAGFVARKFAQHTQAQALQQVNESQQVDQQ
jgi:hypothetical protein